MIQRSLDSEASLTGPAYLAARGHNQDGRVIQQQLSFDGVVLERAPVVLPDECQLDLAHQQKFALYDYFLGATPTAKHPAAAQVFMNWNLSKRGASVFAQIGEYPADSSVPAPNVMGIQMPAMDTGLPQRGMPDDLAKNGKEDQGDGTKLFTLPRNQPLSSPEPLPSPLCL